jgi:3-methyl-2-oxobutanoate hydroxymethyltransferase
MNTNTSPVSDKEKEDNSSLYGKKVRRVTTRTLLNRKKRGEPFVCLTAYDALMARIFDEAGVDFLLVGDSVGNIVQGFDTTLPVTLEEIIYHTKAVVRGTERAMVVSDMPFMSYQVSAEKAFRNAGQIMKEADCGAVKLEGGEIVAEAVSKMTSAGIPVVGHLGLTPQSIRKFGSYKARGTEPEEANQILHDAQCLEQAGAFAIVLEKVPAELAKRVTESVGIPTIGIGAGAHCDGQILVYTDMLGMTKDFNPRFVRRYDNLRERMINATQEYAADTRKRSFPSEEESY